MESSGEGQKLWREEGLDTDAPTLISPSHFSHRNCPTEIILLVWRLVPQVKPPQEAMPRRSSCKSTFDLQSPPNKREKSGRAQAQHRRSCHVLWDGTQGLGLHSWDRYSELGKRGQSTLPALSSAADQNYIILAPLNPGSQVRALCCSISCLLLHHL